MENIAIESPDAFEAAEDVFSNVEQGAEET